MKTLGTEQRRQQQKDVSKNEVYEEPRYKTKKAIIIKKARITNKVRIEKRKYMDRILKLMNERIETLKKSISKAEKDNKKYPEGHLRISSGNNRIRYYHVVQKGDTQGIYITKNNRQLAKELAQKGYKDDFLIKAKDELEKLEFIIKNMSVSNADLAYQNLSSNRKMMVDPYIVPDDLYVKAWQSKTFITNPYKPENKIYDTKKGEKVRSKSEALIADMMYELGIPYHYEKPLYLRGRMIKYPDFTILKMDTRKEIYLEHLGLLNDEGYRKRALNKADEYRENGIYIGKNLLITYETEDNPFDIKGTREMLKEIFCG